MSFVVPVRDQRLVLDAVVRIAELAATERFADATTDTIDAVLEGAAQFAEGEFAPLDRIGDTVGSTLADGEGSGPVASVPEINLPLTFTTSRPFL